MNFAISHIPDRTFGVRSYGLILMMDKGLSLKEAECFIESSATPENSRF